VRLPSEIRISTNRGPIVFTISSGETEMPLGRFRLLLQGHPYAHALVLGTVREARPEGEMYSAFCVDPESGQIVLVDLEPPLRVRFVNTRIDEFLACAELYAANWPDPHLRELLAAIDAEALAYDDSFWVIALSS
jgi:hypothetical protein